MAGLYAISPHKNTNNGLGAAIANGISGLMQDENAYKELQLKRKRQQDDYQQRLADQAAVRAEQRAQQLSDRDERRAHAAKLLADEIARGKAQTADERAHGKAKTADERAHAAKLLANKLAREKAQTADEIARGKAKTADERAHAAKTLDDERAYTRLKNNADNWGAVAGAALHNFDNPDIQNSVIGYANNNPELLNALGVKNPDRAKIAGFQKNEDGRYAVMLRMKDGSVVPATENGTGDSTDYVTLGTPRDIVNSISQFYAPYRSKGTVGVGVSSANAKAENQALGGALSKPQQFLRQQNIAGVENGMGAKQPPSAAEQRAEYKKQHEFIKEIVGTMALNEKFAPGVYAGKDGKYDPEMFTADVMDLVYTQKAAIAKAGVVDLNDPKHIAVLAHLVGDARANDREGAPAFLGYGGKEAVDTRGTFNIPDTTQAILAGQESIEIGGHTVDKQSIKRVKDATGAKSNKEALSMIFSSLGEFLTERPDMHKQIKKDVIEPVSKWYNKENTPLGGQVGYNPTARAAKNKAERKQVANSFKKLGEGNFTGAFR